MPNVKGLNLTLGSGGRGHRKPETDLKALILDPFSRVAFLVIIVQSFYEDLRS